MQVMNTPNSHAWRKEPITLEAWKVNCQASSHVRTHETLTFTDGGHGVITCWIAGSNVFLGSYFTEGCPSDGILPNTGWNH